ncbi:MAG: UDP-N-acetylmuramoylalanyl-D-glutamate--2,6-diaminopimelate ligase [Eggerthellaceae bacterium]|nr:UDP-N-acetylmuramoylalanyl-D-glutamate--2,6-diaminopimelate ligase [Eggerthellaceae bacterium]MDR2716049.1 hypothetical protein [Coriobacteriaceae bacterium]
MVTTTLTCPSCGAHTLDVRDYDSMMVLKADSALFTLCCPHCSKAVSSIRAIPDELKDEVRFAAIELDAGMGRDA